MSAAFHAPGWFTTWAIMCMDLLPPCFWSKRGTVMPGSWASATDTAPNSASTTSDRYIEPPLVGDAGDYGQQSTINGRQSTANGRPTTDDRRPPSGLPLALDIRRPLQGCFHGLSQPPGAPKRGHGCRILRCAGALGLRCSLHPGRAPGGPWSIR